MSSVLPILIGIVVLVVALLAFIFRFLLYPIFPNLNPMKTARTTTLDGPSLFISDLHLRAEHAFPYSQRLRTFLETRHVSNLIVVGDLFDRRQDADKIMARTGTDSIARVLGFAELPIRAFFIQGSRGHDAELKDEVVMIGNFFTPLGRCAILNFKELRIVAYHGHDLAWKGAIGHSWDKFISELSLERAWKGRAGVDDSSWVIFGHTHIPGIDVKHRVANCGGWQRKRFLVRPACTGLLVSPVHSSLEIVHFG